MAGLNHRNGKLTTQATNEVQANGFNINSKYCSQEEISFGDFTRDELNFFLNKCQTSNKVKLSSLGSTKSVPCNINDANSRKNTSSKNSSEFGYSIDGISSSYHSTFSSPHSSFSSTESLKGESALKNQAMDSTEHTEQHQQQNQSKQLLNTTSIQSEELKATGENVRRNKRRKPPNYYQSAEYAAILKNSDSMPVATAVSPSSTSQIGSNYTNDDQLNESLNKLSLMNAPINHNALLLTSIDDSQTESVIQETLKSTNVQNLQAAPELKHATTDKDDKQTQDEPSFCESSQQVPAVIKPLPSSWATLFKNNTENTATSSTSSIKQSLKASVNIPEITNGHTEPASDVKVTNSTPVDILRAMGGIFSECELKHSAPALQPRGIRNNQSWCYINATLQALLACPPFYNLVKSIFQKIRSSNQNIKCVPCLAALGRYMSEFKTMFRQQNDAKANLNIGEPFGIEHFYETLSTLKAEERFKSGRQEDAQEFLSFLLNRIHDEMVVCLESLSSNGHVEEKNEPIVTQKDNEHEPDDSDWNVVGKKNRSNVTRKIKFKRSPLSDIFCGQIRSALSQPGVKEKESLSLEPFFTLPLDIQPDSVRNLQQALDQFVQKEELFGFTNQETKRETEAFKRLSFEDLPLVLIIHLKCFVYDKHGGIQKLLKRIEFQIDLEINKELITPNQRSKLREKRRNYKLFAVEYHYGDKATGGHYITDVYHPGIIGWVRYDDAKVKVVNNAQVLKSDDRKLVPYLLYYRRSDYI